MLVYIMEASAWYTWYCTELNAAELKQALSVVLSKGIGFKRCHNHKTYRVYDSTIT